MGKTEGCRATIDVRWTPMRTEGPPGAELGGVGAEIVSEDKCVSDGTSSSCTVVGWIRGDAEGGREPAGF